jgi:hypothetical protein
MSGGKGGQSTTKVEIPEWLESAAQENLAKAGELSKIGYTPYYGPSVAAMTPMMQQSMAGTNQAAQAFGMGGGAGPNAGMPQARNYGGMQAYSSGDMYDQALRELEMRRPGQFSAMNAPFINPVTGAQPAAPYGTWQGAMANIRRQRSLWLHMHPAKALEAFIRRQRSLWLHMHPAKALEAFIRRQRSLWLHMQPIKALLAFIRRQRSQWPHTDLVKALLAFIRHKRRLMQDLLLRRRLRRPLRHRPIQD